MKSELHLKIRLFDMNGQIPFSQGEAARQIHKNTAGSTIAIGEADRDDVGCYIYIKKAYGEGDVKSCEALWVDDGCRLKCEFRKTDNEPKWFRRIGDTEWEECDLSVEFQK